MLQKISECESLRRFVVRLFAGVLIASYWAAPGFANHCSGSMNCMKLYPGPHPSASKGYMWACHWPDKIHPSCHTVRKGQCDCDPNSGDFRDANDWQNALNLVEAISKCVSQNGMPTLIKDMGNNDLLQWIGLECDLDGGQKWTENHSTSDICFNKANTPPTMPTLSTGPSPGTLLIIPIPPTWCRSD